MSDSAPIDFMDAAALGNTTDLANWIEAHNSIEGIPYDLIAELIRHSKGCFKFITILDEEVVLHQEVENEDGEKESYVSYKTGYVKHLIKPINAKALLDYEKIERDKSIFADYKRLIKTMSKELALHNLYMKINGDLEISTIETIIAEQSRVKREYDNIIKPKISPKPA